MKMFSCRSACTTLALLAFFTVKAQTVTVKTAPANVQIDGVADEWKGYDEHVNEKSRVTYILSSDKDNLYLVLKTKDRKKQQNILGAGVTFSVDPHGKKRETLNVTFPQPDMDDLSEFEHLDDANLKMRVAATASKKIRALGFTGIPPVFPAKKNDHNILASIKLSADGELTLEEAIPLSLFATSEAAAEWAFNIKINGLFVKSAPGFSGGGGDMAPPSGGSSGGGRRGGGAAARVNPAGNSSVRAASMNNSGNMITSSSDFWGKFTFEKL